MKRKQASNEGPLSVTYENNPVFKKTQSNTLQQ